MGQYREAYDQRMKGDGAYSENLADKIKQANPPKLEPNDYKLFGKESLVQEE